MGGGRPAIQIVMGPAGSGKSTYCQTIQTHCAALGRQRRRTVHVANLDPAAEGECKYQPVAFDIRDLIAVDEVMDELHLGPNGALMYCMEYLLDNMDWLRDHLDGYDEDEYLIFDCPGQIELYTHVPVMKRIIDQMRMWGYDSSLVSVFVVDATFLCDAPKFLSGSLLSLSAMIALELPHINVLSKCDLVDKEEVERVLDVESATQLWTLEEHAEAEAEERLVGLMMQAAAASGGVGGGANARGLGGRRRIARNPYDLNQVDDPPATTTSDLVSSSGNNGPPSPAATSSITPEVSAPTAASADAGNDEDDYDEEEDRRILSAMQSRRRKRNRLTEAICSLLDDYTMVSFLPLDITNEDSIDTVLTHVDHTIQWGEDLEVREADFGGGEGEGETGESS